MPEPVGDPHSMYTILTVCLDKGETPASDRDAYDRLKAKLGLASPVIDDVYGAMPATKVLPWMEKDLPKNSYLVLVDSDESFRLMHENHPNVVGMYHAALVPSGRGPTPEQAAARMMNPRKPKAPGI